MNVNPDFADFVKALIHRKVEFVVVGAFSLAFHGAPRGTGDIDIWVRPLAPNVKSLLRAIEDFGFGSLGITEQDVLSGQILQMGVAPVRIDVITILDGVSSDEIWSNRQKGPLGDQTVNYLGRDIFIKNKRAAGRPKDLADLAALGEKPGP